MEKNNNKQQVKKQSNAKFMLVFSCALLLVMMITFGVTMAFLGNKTGGDVAKLTIKSGIVFDKTGTDTQKLEIKNDYMIPGTYIEALCKVTVKSKATSNYDQIAVNGLLRTDFKFDGEMKDFLSVSSTPANVYLGYSETDMIDTNKVAKLMLAGDGYWYLVDGVSATTLENSTLLYDIPCKTNNGTVSLVFKIKIQVNNVSSVDSSVQFVNEHQGKGASIQANFKVVQSEFYSGSSAPLERTYANAKNVFGSN